MSLPKAQLRRDGFTFKQFFVAHNRCAMKVGTDGILLGAWSPVAGVKRILDIGSGSGLVALMLAQRTNQHVTIDAIELDAPAAIQAAENASESPWADRVQVECADILVWAAEQTARYDLSSAIRLITNLVLNAPRHSVTRRDIPDRLVMRRC